MAELRIGTCSWKYPSWHRLVYSEPKGINYLAEYARRYDTVEVDQWFWSLFGGENIGLPSPTDVETYRLSVPDDFKFTVKVPNSITLTHFYKKSKGDPLVANPHFLSASLFKTFLSLLAPLEDVLGPLMFQFEYLNREKMASQQRFEELLEGFRQQLPDTCQYGVEVRNARYLNPSYFEFLARNGLSPVLLEGYWMPPIAQVYSKWRSLIAGHGPVVIRLLGPDRKGIEKEAGKRWDQIVASKDEQLGAIAEMVEDLLGRGVDVYVNVNNHYEGSAPLTIERLQQLFVE
jgi:uncharacterized protein YecE (DUF72 family)